MRFIRKRRILAGILAAACVAAPTSASASAGILPPTFASDAAQSGATGSTPATDRSDAAQSGATGSTPATDRSDAAQSGRYVGATRAFPPAGFRGGDTPADFASTGGASGAAPTTIEVVRPERTIVRDVDEALPLILSGAALLLVLAGLAVTLLHTGVVPRPGRTR